MRWIHPNCPNCTINNLAGSHEVDRLQQELDKKYPGENRKADILCRIYDPENWNGLCAYQSKE